MPSPVQRQVSGRSRRPKDNVDVLVKAVSMCKLHRTCPASGLYNLASIYLLTGTVANAVTGFSKGITEKMVCIGHPEGIV